MYVHAVTKEKPLKSDMEDLVIVLLTSAQNLIAEYFDNSM